MMAESKPTLTRKSSTTAGQNKGGVAHILVAVRARPLNDAEKKSGTDLAVQCMPESHTVKLVAIPHLKRQEKNFHYDQVFGMYSKQEEIYDSVVEPIVLESLKGFNCTAFAYGPTGTGKTHTMEGKIEEPDQWGMIPRAAETLLNCLTEKYGDFTMKVSYLELYNEELHDLLSTAQERRPLKLIEDLKRGVICQNLEEFNVTSKEEVMELLHRGVQARITAVTLKNQNSSRSHAIFSFRVIVKENNGEEEVVSTGQLNLVDLAGAESVGRSGAKNDRAREAGSINQSLLTLGRVITTLVDRAGHVPYRDSKLTRLLQESLGGRAKTCIIATVSPSITCLDESQSTLEYAMRARNVKNQPIQNSQVSQKIVMKEKFIEIEALRAQLMQTREKNGVYVEPSQFYAMESKIATLTANLAECEGALAKRDEEVKTLKADKQELTLALEDTKKELEAADQLVEEMTGKFEQAREEVKQTFIELKATEAVVGEQVSTETKLFSQGTALQRDLGACQDDVEKLLEKVDLLGESEAQKVRDTQEFVEQLSTNAAALASQVQIMSQQSQEQSQQLAKSVSKMLKTGRETCDSLKAAIEKASMLMISNAERSREDMQSSCRELKGHFSDTNAQVDTKMKTLKDELVLWLDDLDMNVEKTQEQIKSLHNEMDLASSAVSHHCTAMNDLAEVFSSKQDALYKDSTRHTEDLRNELHNRLQFFQKETTNAVNKANASILSKSEAMENSLRAMLKDLVRTSTTALEGCSKSANELISEGESRLNQGTAAIRSTHQEIQSNAVTYSEQALQMIDQMRQTYHSHAHEVEFHRDTARTTVEAMQAAVVTERKNLDSDVQNILEEIEAALLKGSLAVDETSAVADRIVDDVGLSSKKMNETVNESMTTFTKYIDKEGEELSSSIGQHFSAADSHFEAQLGGLTAIKDDGTQHGQSITDSTLQPRATTPRKQRQISSASSQPLNQTREHEDIKSDSRKALQADLETQFMLFQGQLDGQRNPHTPLKEAISSDDMESPRSSIRTPSQRVINGERTPEI